MEVIRKRPKNNLYADPHTQQSNSYTF